MKRKFKTGEKVQCNYGSHSIGKITFCYKYNNEYIYTVEGNGYFGDINEKYLEICN